MDQRRHVPARNNRLRNTIVGMQWRPDAARAAARVGAHHPRPKRRLYLTRLRSLQVLRLRVVLRVLSLRHGLGVQLLLRRRRRRLLLTVRPAHMRRWRHDHRLRLRRELWRWRRELWRMVTLLASPDTFREQIPERGNLLQLQSKFNRLLHHRARTGCGKLLLTS